MVVGGELELEGSVLGLGRSRIVVQLGLGIVQRLLLGHVGEAAEAMVTEQGHELRLGLLGHGTSAQVVPGEGGRNELGLHEELRRMGLVDLL